MKKNWLPVSGITYLDTALTKLLYVLDHYTDSFTAGMGILLGTFSNCFRLLIYVTK